MHLMPFTLQSGTDIGKPKRKRSFTGIVRRIDQQDSHFPFALARIHV